MDTAFKVNAMTLAADESLLLLGDASGELLLVDPHTLAVVSRTQGHGGDIYAIASHPRLPLAATMSMDRTVILWDLADPARPQRRGRFNLRRVVPWNDVDRVPANPSQSQALCFHPTSPRLATRSASAGVVELDYSGPSMELLHCTRMHGTEDVTTVRYPWDDSHHLLSGALGSVVLSENGLVVQSWRVGKHNVHWFEPVGDEHYLIATDDRRIVRFDLGQREVVVTGPVFTRDDLEHVHYNRTSQRAYVVGFDRNVYEVDPETCAPVEVVYRAPFKMRWFKTLTAAPDTAFVQCFDGGLYRVDLATRRCTAARRHTPPALWTGCRLGDGTLALTGEGDELVFLRPRWRADARTPSCEIVRRVSKDDERSFTKRMVLGPDGALWLGQASGRILRHADNATTELRSFGSAVRDLALTPRGDRVLVCLERGELHSLDPNSGESLATWSSSRDQPLWALAVRPCGDVVAVAERGGEMAFLDPHDLRPVRTGPDARRVKRIRWLDDDTMLYNEIDQLVRYRWSTDRVEPLVGPTGNTIEDFAWSAEHGYLVLINYATDVVLCDLETGEALATCADQIDYSKGLVFLEPDDPTAYPLDFITFGRSGAAHLFRIHNEKCVQLGPFAPALLTRHYALAQAEPPPSQ